MQRREAALVEGGNGGQRRAGGRQPAWICPESARIEGYPGDCKLLCLSARSVGVHTVVAMITRGRGEWERERKEERKEWGETEREPKKAAARRRRLRRRPPPATHLRSRRQTTAAVRGEGDFVIFEVMLPLAFHITLQISAQLA